jgi:micrococcal nuclease
VGVAAATLPAAALSITSSTMRWAGVAAMIAVMITACSPHRVLLVRQAPPTRALEPSGYEEAVVTRVVDGDTIEVRITGRVAGPGAGRVQAGSVVSVRLLGVDTPESVDPRRPVECFGKEASAAADALLEGRRVRMVKDVEETDGFDRLLRYVYVGAEMANARMVVNGYASAYTYPPNTRWSELFVQLQREAREEDRGLWSPEICGGTS